MLNKSVLSFVLSFGMLTASLPNGVSTGVASLGGMSALRSTGSSLIETDETVAPDGAETDEVSAPDGAGTDEAAVPNAPETDEAAVPNAPETDEAVVPNAAETGVSAQADQEVMTEDFEGTDIGTWGMEVPAGGTLGVVEDSTNSANHYLNFTVKEKERTSTRKLFGTETAPEMESASMSFRWYTTTVVSNSNGGYAGLRIMDGSNEIVSLYLNDIRGQAGKQNTTPLYYTVNGAADKVKTEATIDVNTIHDMVLNFDFEAHKLEIKMDGNTVVSNVEFNPLTKSVESFAFHTVGSKPTVNIGIDDFRLDYVKGSTSADLSKVISSVAVMEEKTQAKINSVTEIVHPASVNVVMGDGSTVEAEINGATWSVTPEFNDFAEMGTYTWTADISLADGVTNPLGLKASYVMKYMSDFLETDINSLAQLPEVVVTKQSYEAGYQHPQTVTATLVNGTTIEAEIDQNTWTCTPDFDPAAKQAYVWTAQLVDNGTNRNHRNLTVSYQMNCKGDYVSAHDFEDDFSFGVWDSTAWGRSLDKDSHSGYLTLSRKQSEDGNYYMFASVTNAGGGRGTRKDFAAEAVKGAVISFDWMPVTAGPADVGSGNIDFFSTKNNQNYFTLRFDSDYKISYFTKGDYNNDSVQPEFTGAISEDNRVDTGLGGQNKWFTVKLTFDYFAHTAKLELAEKENPEHSYTATVPIEESANGLSIMVMRLDRYQNARSSAEMGLDNVILDYDRFGAEDVVDVKNPAHVNVAKSQYNEFEFPTTVEVTLGDTTKIEVPVGEWTAEPAFDLNTSAEGDYVWSAPLVLDGLNNVYGLQASFTMTYTNLPFPTYVYNPNTLELAFGQELPAAFPTETYAMMSSGEIDTVAVGEWTPIRPFNANEEGIYVYGANVVPTDGKYSLVDGMITPNENPADPSAQREDYNYDVYYRVSYFETGDSYNAYARSMEYLDRGVYAIKKENGVFVSWRLLVTEYGENIGFNVYRNGELVNETPITSKTNFVDASGNVGDTYVVAKVQDGREYESKEVKASAENYISIPVQKPDPQPTKDGVLAGYTLNDAGVADVDGDGEYEIIVKWYPDNAFDSGMANGPSSPTIFDVYEMDGTPLWRLNLGLEMPSGAHFNQFIMYDMDEDGKAELFIKTSDGTISYRPNAEGRFDMNDESTIVSYIGDRSVTPGTNIEPNGHVNKNSHEYVTVFNGLTGQEIDTIDYVNTTGEFTDWGKADGGNRSARYNAAVAYLPKNPDQAGSTETIPAVLLNRGYYAKTTIAAYTLRDGKLNLEWNFVRQTGENEAAKGNHNVSTGDIDKDGFDEIIIGALAVDHDGSVLWVKDGKNGQDFAGHADTIHLAAMNPENNDLYVFVPAEEQDSTVNHSLTNAATGTRLNGGWFTRKDVGRAVAANITPNPGYEYWSAAGGGGIASGIYGFDGSVISTTKPVSMNWRMYWDGDLLSELGDGIATDDDWAVTKYNWVNNTVDTLTVLEGTKTNNSTKKTPSLTADLFGDWREEVMLRNDDDTELRIYMTTEETDYIIYTLMHDPVYRNAVANQNTAYNQPPHIGFYLGEDNADTVLSMDLPTANVKYTVNVNEAGRTEE